MMDRLTRVCASLGPVALLLACEREPAIGPEQTPPTAIEAAPEGSSTANAPVPAGTATAPGVHATEAGAAQGISPPQAAAESEEATAEATPVTPAPAASAPPKSSPPSARKPRNFGKKDAHLASEGDMIDGKLLGH